MSKIEDLRKAFVEGATWRVMNGPTASARVEAIARYVTPTRRVTNIYKPGDGRQYRFLNQMVELSHDGKTWQRSESFTYNGRGLEVSLGVPGKEFEGVAAIIQRPTILEEIPE